MDRQIKIDILTAIQGGRLSVSDYSDLPSRDFIAVSKQESLEVEPGIYFYQKYKEQTTGEVFTDDQMNEIIKPYAACMPANSLYWATAAFFGIGIDRVTLQELSKAEQLQKALLKLSK